jgi:hypothetical protein
MTDWVAKPLRSAIKKDRIDELLGASVRFPVKVAHAPWDFYKLLESLKGRVQPGKGKGRPTNEEWTIRRLVGFRDRTWKRLQRLSEASVRRGGPRLSPAQIAAFLIEETIDKTEVG